MVFTLPNEQSNFKATNKIQMSNEGLEDMVGFMSVEGATAEILGKNVEVTRIFLTGRPEGDVFVWQAGIILNNEVSVVYTEKPDEFTTQFLKKAA